MQNISIGIEDTLYSYGANFLGLFSGMFSNVMHYFKLATGEIVDGQGRTRLHMAAKNGKS